MKRFLSLALALMLVFSLVACSSDEETTGKKGKNDKDAVEETVTSFMDAYVNLEFDSLKDYVVDENSIPSEFADLNIDAAFNTMMAEMPAEMAPYSDDFKGFFDNIIGKMKEDLTYEIKEIEKLEDEDGYNVTVSVTIPEVDDFDFDSILGEDELSTVLSDLLSSGKINENMTEQEMMDVMVDAILNYANNAISNVEFETSTDDMELAVVKADNGEWLIEF